MADNIYLTELTKQKTKLATTLNNKGVTASESEKFNTLVPKVKNIVNLLDEEKTVDVISQYNNIPESIVQLDYPEDIDKKIDLQLSSKNLLNADDIKNMQYVTIVSKGNGACVIKLVSSTNKLTPITCLYEGLLPVGTYYFTAKLKIENTLGTKRDNEILVFINKKFINFWNKAYSGDGEYNVLLPFNVTDPNSEVRISFYPTVNSATPTTEYQATFTDIQFEYGSTTTSYTPYISDFSTVNVTACGKNLIPYPYYNAATTINGVTFTVNTDGSIALSGTSTRQATFYFMYSSLNLKKGITYTFSASGDYSFNGSATLYIYDSKQGQTAYIPLATDKKVTFTPNVDIKNTNCYIVVPADRTASGTIKVQLELGSTATAYAPYQAPTIYTSTADGIVTGIQNYYPTTNILTDNAGALITVKGGAYKEILPSTGKNGITKVYQEVVSPDMVENLKPENIKKGITILGITGTME